MNSMTRPFVTIIISVIGAIYDAVSRKSKVPTSRDKKIPVTRMMTYNMGHGGSPSGWRNAWQVLCLWYHSQTLNMSCVNWSVKIIDHASRLNLDSEDVFHLFIFQRN
jgi:hypothetical protein